MAALLTGPIISGQTAHALDSGMSTFIPEPGIQIRWGVWKTRQSQPFGTVVLLGGRTEFLEKYTETILELGVRGYDVFSMDWRGQGLSTHQLADPDKGYVDHFSSYVRDLEFFMENIVRPDHRAPMVFLVHSMGGMNLINYLHKNPHIKIPAVVLSPMWGIDLSPISRLFGRIATKAIVHLGFGDRYIVGAGPYNKKSERFEDNPLTLDPVRFRIIHQWIRKNRRLAVGGVTFKWVEAAFDAIDNLKTPGYIEAIQNQILILSAGEDTVVSRSSQEEISERLKNGYFFVVPNSKHEILMESDEVRSQFWEYFDGFTSKVIPAVDS